MGSNGGEMTKPAPRSYLLRCWPETGVGGGGACTWRFALIRLGDEPRTTAFASLEEVYDRVLGELEGEGAAAGEERG